MFPIRARQRPIPSITASDLPYFQFYDLPHRTHTQYKRSLSMPSERTVTIRSHTPQTATMKRFNKKTTKNRKTRLPHHIQPPPQKKASHMHLPSSTQKIKVNVNAAATQFLTPTPSPQHRSIRQIPSTIS